MDFGSVDEVRGETTVKRRFRAIILLFKSNFEGWKEGREGTEGSEVG